MSTNEAVNRPDGECIFSEVVAVNYEARTEEDRLAVFQSSHNKFVVVPSLLFWLLAIIFSPSYISEVYYYEVRQYSSQLLPLNTLTNAFKA